MVRHSKALEIALGVGSVASRVSTGTVEHTRAVVDCSGGEVCTGQALLTDLFLSLHVVELALLAGEGLLLLLQWLAHWRLQGLAYWRSLVVVER